jgi:mannose-6-phosphate isomerase-like protein (cupin superfamily)
MIIANNALKENPMTDYQKKGYLLEDYRLFHLRSDTGTRPDYHYHEFAKILLLVSGSGSYVVDGQRYAIRSGDAVLIGSGCVHRPEFEVGVPYERIILYISPEFLQRQSVPDCDLSECFSGRFGHVLRTEESRQQPIFTLAAALEKELSGKAYKAKYPPVDEIKNTKSLHYIDFDDEEEIADLGEYESIYDKTPEEREKAAEAKEEKEEVPEKQKKLFGKADMKDEK